MQYPTLSVDPIEIINTYKIINKSYHYYNPSWYYGCPNKIYWPCRMPIVIPWFNGKTMEQMYIQTLHPTLSIPSFNSISSSFSLKISNSSLSHSTLSNYYMFFFIISYSLKHHDLYLLVYQFVSEWCIMMFPISLSFYQ